MLYFFFSSLEIPYHDAIYSRHDYMHKAIYLDKQQEMRERTETDIHHGSRRSKRKNENEQEPLETQQNSRTINDFLFTEESGSE
jgi:hypothetical protein